MVSVRPIATADFETIGAIIESSYAPHDPAQQLPRFPTALGGPPFSWWGDTSLSWWLGLVDDAPVAFAMWRQYQRHVHLHALFVASGAQRRGVATLLLRFHFEQAIRENPGIESYTLHVRHEAAWARALYAREGYEEREHLTWPDEGKLLLRRRRADQR